MILARRFLSCPILLAPLLLLAIPAADAASLSKRYIHFTLTGNTLAELEDEMARRGPAVRSTGERHPGATRVEFKTTVEYMPAGKGCRVSKAHVAVDARITLPRWKPRSRPAQEERLLWVTLLSDIKRHEERHAGIAMNHARDLEQDILRLDRGRDCESLAVKVERLTARRLQLHGEAQRRFDRIEAANFETRFNRLFNYRLQQIEKQR